MLKIISSKNESEIYSYARKEKNKANFTSSFLDCAVEDVEVKAQDVQLFGGEESYIVRVGRKEEIEIITRDLLEILENSKHFFVLVGNGADFEKQMKENLDGEKFKKNFIKIEEKFVQDFPTALVQALQKKDKKNSWNLLLKELHDKDAEPIHGSCIFAYKSLLTVLNNPKENDIDSAVKDFSWNQAKRAGTINGVLRDRQEVVNTYFELVLAYHKARLGEGDLSMQLEKWVLTN